MAPHRSALVRPAGSRLSEGHSERLKVSLLQPWSWAPAGASRECVPTGTRMRGAWALPRPGEADPRLHGVRRRLHSPGSLPGVALGRLSSPRAARSHLVEPPEETLVLLFGLSLKAACVKKSACVVCSAPRVFTDGPQPCNPGWEPKRDQRQGPRSLPSGHCPSPPSTTGPDGDFPGPGFRSFCASSAPAVDRLWLLALSCVAVADPAPSPPCRSHRPDHSHVVASEAGRLA